MHRHRVVRVLPFRPEQLFDLVGDVERYPEFVPWITAMRLRNLRSEGEGVTLVDAEAAVGFSFLNERFATRVRRDADQRDIIVTLLWGPFKRLLNHWRFEPDPVGCKVVFEIDFAFKSRVLEMLLAANFDRAVDKLMACFEARAESLYPKLSVSPSAEATAAQDPLSQG
ncbi:MAG TPA: SRPBCC family protein [Caulobacteraceae bacterium]|nr:SRPBCC family protein [Caulobacteraceae bacterium]